MPKKILLVEDDSDIQQFLKELLTDSGYSVQAESDGLSALNSFKNEKPDIVVVDLGIPEMSGEDLVAHIKKRDPDIPIIILSARDSERAIIKGFKLGVDEYIPKPFVADDLLEKLKVMLKNK
jgi:DNA-binding response OmpR family regulator